MNEIILGSYEGYIMGYTLQSGGVVKKLKQTFFTHSYQATVRCLSVGGKYLASGSTDDKVAVIDLETREQHTLLVKHIGIVNAVAFTHSGSHLLTASDDGNIKVTRTDDWEIDKAWYKAHGGHAVSLIAVHPSDKLALSIGGDKTIRAWNLIKGHPAFTMNLVGDSIQQPTELKFCPSGHRFSVLSQETVDIWSLSNADIEKRLTWKSIATTVQWINDDRICVAFDNGNIVNVTVTDTQAVKYVGHNKQRVKCLQYKDGILYSAACTGQLKAWSLDGSVLMELCVTYASCRLMCIEMNKQCNDVKKEDKSDEPELNIQDTVKSDQSNDEEEKAIKALQKRRVQAFDVINFDSDDESINGGAGQQPKKLKKRNRTIKNEIKKVAENET